MGKRKYWGIRSGCQVVKNKLKYVYLRGYKDNDEEFEFIKHIVTTGKKLEKVVIRCRQRVDQQRLRSLMSPSPNLVIILEFKIQSVEDEIKELQDRDFISL